MARKKTQEALDEELNTETAASENPAAELTGQPAQSEREPGEDSQKSWLERASVIVDPEAGAKFSFDYEKHKAIITFNEKPTPEVLAIARPILSDGGFELDKVNKDGWQKKIAFTQREDDRSEAKKTFYALANAIREQKGLPARSFGEAIGF